MGKKTNCVKGGKEYFRIRRKVGMKLNKNGLWVDDYKDFYGSCKSEAEQAYNSFMERKSAGIVNNKCLGELIDQWIEEIFKSSNLADNTKARYISVYRNYFQKTRIAGLQVNEVTAMDLQGVYNKSKASYATLRALHNLLLRFYKYAELNGICRNIAVSVTVPKTKQNTHKTDSSRIEVWEDDELKEVLEGLQGTTLRFLIVLAANTGARFSELLALTYDDIQEDILYINKQLTEVSLEDGKKREIKVSPTKTANSNRAIPLSDFVLKELEAHIYIQKKEMLENGYRTNNIFTTSTGTYYYRRNVVRALNRLYKRIGVPYHKFHAYRHTFGTNLSRAGVPIEETAALMGHSSINVTAKYYVDISIPRRREAVEKIAAYSL